MVEYRRSRLKVKVVRVSQDSLCTTFANLFDREGFYRCLGSHWNKCRCLNLAVGGTDSCAAGPGMVATPYTIADLEAVLAQVSGDRVFAREFFARYVEGRELVDYARLLKRAGLMVRRPQEGRPTLGSVQLSAGSAKTAQPMISAKISRV